MSGQLKFRKNFNVPYTTIKMSGDNIIMYNSSQICVMNSRGVQKYMGSVDGTIRDFFKIGWNKYLMVLDTGVSTIKFSQGGRHELDMAGTGCAGPSCLFCSRRIQKRIYKRSSICTPCADFRCSGMVD